MSEEIKLKERIKELETLLEKRNSYINVLLSLKEKLEKENIILKKTIRDALSFLPFNLPPSISLETPEGPIISWSEKSEKFKAIDKCLLETVIWLTKKELKAMHYDEITKAFKARYQTLYSKIKNPEDTLSRRLRFLREWGYLTSPEKGYFFPGPRLKEEFEKTKAKSSRIEPMPF